jgi:hypothetical protein
LLNRRALNALSPLLILSLSLSLVLVLAPDFSPREILVPPAIRLIPENVLKAQPSSFTILENHLRNVSVDSSKRLPSEHV